MTSLVVELEREEHREIRNKHTELFFCYLFYSIKYFIADFVNVYSNWFAIIKYITLPSLYISYFDNVIIIYGSD